MHWPTQLEYVYTSERFEGERKLARLLPKSPSNQAIPDLGRNGPPYRYAGLDPSTIWLAVAYWDTSKP